MRSKGKRDTKLIGWAGERVERAHSCMHTHTERHCLYTDSENTKETKEEWRRERLTARPLPPSANRYIIINLFAHVKVTV